jgi:hypothetical protein
MDFSFIKFFNVETNILAEITRPALVKSSFLFAF